MTEFRVASHAPITGFVIAEDRSFEARAQRAWRIVRYELLRVAVLARRGYRRVQNQMVAWRADLASLQLPLACRRLGAMVRVAMAPLLAFLVLLHHAISREQKKRYRSSTRVLLAGIALLSLAAAVFLPEAGSDAGPTPPDPATIGENRSSVSLASLAIAPAEANEAPLLVTLSPNPPQLWQPVRKPIALFHLESTEVAGAEFTYRAFTRGESRQDVLAWSARPSDDERLRRPLAVLKVERQAAAGQTEKPLFADLAARAAEQHLIVARMARPDQLPTKFGPVEIAEMTLQRGAQNLPCLAFRRLDMAGVTLIGWMCGTRERPVDRIALGCFVDRLDLIGGGRDPALRRMFSEAERNRKACASSRQPGRRLTWMDHEAPVPGLKLSQRGR